MWLHQQLSFRRIFGLVVIIFTIVDQTRSLPLVDPGVFVLQGVATCRGGKGYCLLGLTCSIDKDFIEDDQHGHCEGLTQSFTSQISFVCCQYTNETVDKAEIYETTISSYTINDEKFALLDENPVVLSSHTDEELDDDVDPSSLINIIGVVTDHTGIVKLVTEPYRVTTPASLNSSFANNSEAITPIQNSTSATPNETLMTNNDSTSETTLSDSTTQETLANYHEIPLDLSFWQEKNSSTEKGSTNVISLESPIELITDKPYKEYQQELEAENQEEIAIASTEIGTSKPYTENQPELDVVPSEMSKLDAQQIVTEKNDQPIMMDEGNGRIEIAIPFKIPSYVKPSDVKTTGYNDMEQYKPPSTVHGNLDTELEELLDYSFTTSLPDMDDQDYGLKLPEEDDEILRNKEDILTINSKSQLNNKEDSSQTGTEKNVKNKDAFSPSANKGESFDLEQRPLTIDELEQQPPVPTNSTIERVKTDVNDEIITTPEDRTTEFLEAVVSGSPIQVDIEVGRKIDEQPFMRYQDVMVDTLQKLDDAEEDKETKPYSLNLNSCGIQKSMLLVSERKSMEAVSVYEWCWSAAIVTKNFGKHIYECSGALIEQNLVVTSAACLKRLQSQDISQFRVILGDSNLNDELPYGIQFHDMIELIPHPDFLTSKGAHVNDIGLIRLKDYATLKNNVCLICLSQITASIPNDNCVVSGYKMGNVPKQLRYDGIVPPNGMLRMAPIDLDANSNCVSSLEKMSLNPLLMSNPETFICERQIKPLEPCINTFDGGSPLACMYNNRWFLAGLASWSMDCSSYPSIYTKVSSYSDWILSTRQRLYGTVLL